MRKHLIGAALLLVGLSVMAPTCVDSGFVPIFAGTFTMGSPVSEPGRQSNEAEHQVTLTHTAEMMIYPVTQGQFQAMFGYNPSTFASCGPNCPVETLHWFDAIAYANQLSTQNGLTPCYVWVTSGDDICGDGKGTGNPMNCMNAQRKGISNAVVALNGVSSVYDCTGYRLPTEAEYEHAERAGSDTAFYDGPITNSSTNCAPLDPNLDAIGWYCGNDDVVTKPVGMKAPNAWGLYDTTGNVTEFVWDWYGDYTGDATDPQGPASGDVRAARGGYILSTAAESRSAARNREYGAAYIGFRLVRTLP